MGVKQMGFEIQVHVTLIGNTSQLGSRISNVHEVLPTRSNMG
jgi:hypothetical protein